MARSRADLSLFDALIASFTDTSEQIRTRLRVLTAL
jgi:hypothetical protein